MDKLKDDDVFAALGDPLIKGLTEVANVKPKDPVAFLASFLHNFPEHEKPQLGTQVSLVVACFKVTQVKKTCGSNFSFAWPKIAKDINDCVSGIMHLTELSYFWLKKLCYDF